MDLNYIRHHCKGLGDNTEAFVIPHPVNPVVRVGMEVGDDQVIRRWPYCPGCGAHASFLALGGRGPLPMHPVAARPTQVVAP